MNDIFDRIEENEEIYLEMTRYLINTDDLLEELLLEKTERVISPKIMTPKIITNLNSEELPDITDNMNIDIPISVSSEFGN